MKFCISKSRITRGTMLTALSLTTMLSLQSEVQAAQQLEEVVVTAQHREESAQEVPISLLAYGSDDVEKARLTDLGEIVAITPNVVVGDETQTNQHIFVRGIGTILPGAGATQSVGYAVDGVFLTRAGSFNQDLFDLERVEVLRGPQGTLYGRNVVGGMVNTITKKPELGQASARIELGMGSYDLFESKAMVNVPIGDDTALRAVVNYRERDGYIDNIFKPADSTLLNPDPFNDFGQCKDCNGDMDNVDSLAMRIQLGGNASENLSWNFSVFRNEIESDGVHIKNTNLISGFLADLAFEPASGSHDVINGNEMGGLDQEFTMATLHFDYESDLGTVTSISGWQSLNYQELRDIVNIPFQYNFVGFPFDTAGGGMTSQWDIDEDMAAFSQ